MKPLLIALTFLASLFVQPALANDMDVKPSVLKTFNKTFTTAKNVEWTITENLYKARFELSGQIVTAYYSTDGSQLAVARNITSHQLPLTLQTAMKKEYPAHWITDLFELTNDEGTTYYVTLETADTKVVLQSASTTAWHVYQKTQQR
ncbi:MAG: hypothetical protein ACO1NX_00980 [Chitinophagaceae bacterium]